MFQLLSPEHVKMIEAAAGQAARRAARNGNRFDPSPMAGELSRIIDRVHADIPPKKRISLGRYSIVRDMGIALYPLLREAGVEPCEFGENLFHAGGSRFTAGKQHPSGPHSAGTLPPAGGQPCPAGADPFVRSLGVQLVSLYGMEPGNLDAALRIFEEAADDDDWLVRECSVGFVRKLFKKYPDAVGNWYRRMVASGVPNQRRFACESLRPVVENGWFRKKPELVIPVIEPLFRESSPYPRTSAGNSLSDWMRIDPEMTWKIVEKLARGGDKNSWWIAYRACRNIVKREPEKVMKLLGIDTYKYKDRVFSSDRPAPGGGATPGGGLSAGGRSRTGGSGEDPSGGALPGGEAP